MNIVVLSTIIVSLLLSCATSNPCNKIGEWKKVKPIPQIHQEGQPTAVINNKLYIFGAFGTNDLIPTTAISVYDPQKDEWKTLETRTPFEKSHVNCAYDDRYIYMVAGFTGPNPGVASKEAYVFDTQTEKFERLPDLPENRASGAVFLDDQGLLHYVGGLIDRNVDSEKHFILDPAKNDSWFEGPPIPAARNHMQAVVIKKRAYIPGGQFGHDTYPNDQPLFHAYDFETKSWITLANLPKARSHAEPSTINMNNRVVMFGGRYDGYPRHDDIIEYNPAEDAWYTLGKLPTGEHINPSAGFFPDITVDGKRGSYVVLTAGGSDWNIGLYDTWIAEVTFVCDDPLPTPPPSTSPPPTEPVPSPPPTSPSPWSPSPWSPSPNSPSHPSAPSPQAPTPGSPHPDGGAPGSTPSRPPSHHIPSSSVRPLVSQVAILFFALGCVAVLLL